MPRAFIAIDLPAHVRRALYDVGRALDEAVTDVRWVREPSLHLTLRFLGDVEEALVPAVLAGLESVAAKHPAFDLHLDEVGAFPRDRKGRVVWVGVSGAVERLANLQAEVEASVRSLGFEAEKRPFTPHITIGRSRQRRGGFSLPAQRPRPEGAFPVNRLVLMASELAPGGARYTPLGTVLLQAAAEP